MNGQITALFLFSLCFCACTHALKIRQGTTNSDIERANRMVSKKVATFTLADSHQIRAKQILITPDSTTFYDLDSQLLKTISNMRIKHIMMKSRGKGALEGMGLGFLVGFTTGMVLGAASYDESNILDLSQTETAMLTGAYVGVVGALIGVPIGGQIKSKDKIEIY